MNTGKVEKVRQTRALDYFLRPPRSVVSASMMAILYILYYIDKSIQTNICKSLNYSQGNKLISEDVHLFSKIFREEDYLAS